MAKYCEVNNKAKRKSKCWNGVPLSTLYLTISLVGLRRHAFHWAIRNT